MKQDQHVVVGRIGKSHGVHGWMRVQSFTEPPEQLLQYQPWYWDSDKQPVAVTASEQKGNHLLIKLPDCDDPETVRAHYTNRNIVVSRDQLPEAEGNEHYWQDLIGCAVHTKDGNSLGTIDHLFRTPGNDVIVTKQGQKKHLIPWLNDVVLDTDLVQQRITVDWDQDF